MANSEQVDMNEIRSVVRELDATITLIHSFKYLVAMPLKADAEEAAHVRACCRNLRSSLINFTV